MSRITEAIRMPDIGPITDEIVDAAWAVLVGDEAAEHMEMIVTPDGNLAIGPLY